MRLVRLVAAWLLASGYLVASSQLSLLGLFELTGNGSGRAELAAAQLAVQHVNSARLLSPHLIKLFVNDTKCDPGTGLDAFFHAIYTRREKMMALLGSSCSDVTESLAKVVPYWNMVQVSFGSTSPALSDRREFPFFFRTVAPDSSHNPARVALLKKFSWATVTAFYQDQDIYSLAVNELVTELERANISCRAAVTFAESDISDQLALLRDLDTRIIIGSFSPAVAPQVFCEAYRLGMYGADYGWLVEGRPSDDWWSAPGPCGHNLVSAARGIILISSHSSMVGNHTVSGLNRRELEAILPWTGFSRESYDAVWTISLALASVRAVQDLGKYDYASRDIVRLLTTTMASLSFNGVSGPVSFDGPDRVGVTAFYQLQEWGPVMVGRYDGLEALLEVPCQGCHRLSWPGGHRPVAERVFKTRTVSVQPAVFFIVAVIAAVGVILSVVFLSINLHFRKHKYIKLSSPKLNNMAVVGCILVYTAVILLGLDTGRLPSPQAFSTVCTARVYLLSAGFSMAFGSMFAKTYRVHRIFTRSARGVVKNKLLQDTQLISLICVLLVVDGLIVTLWVTVDPIERQLRNLSLEISPMERSIVYQPQIEVCSSQFIHSWLGVLYVYKGLLLVVGVYMAWETRHVKIPALNDSQYIGLSVYSVVITSVLVVVLANLVSERVTLAFLSIAVPILVSTTGSLCLLFIPKLHDILNSDQTNTTLDPIMQSMGLKIECNTRRFLADDRRELYFRVEVQNKVYRREIQLLDTEINKLERQIAEVSMSSSRSTLGPHRIDLEEAVDQVRGKSPSVSGGIPLLLLSVLPPVIPRASWPTEDSRRGVTFSSEPKLGEPRGSLSLPTPDHPPKLSVIGRFLNMITPSVRKSSAPAGLASALRAHMEYFAGFVPGNNSGSLESSFSNSRTGINRAPHLNIDDFDIRERKFSLGFPAREDRDEEMVGRRSVQSLSQPRVSFSIQHQHSQPILTYRDRPKGSPRFPHRIVPTSSLNDLKKRDYLAVTRGDTKCRSLEETREKTKEEKRGGSLSPTCELWFGNTDSQAS